LTSSTRPTGTVDILLVNPPTPDGGIWIRSQHRVGRRSRENMIWPQVSLAQMAALLKPEYSVEIIDANALRMGWPEFEKLLEEKRPKYYLTQVTAPTLRNDMYGVFLAKALGAKTMAFGTHVTPMTLETMRPFPALDFVLRGEPEMTLRELLDTLEGKTASDPRVQKMLAETSHVQSRVKFGQTQTDAFSVTDANIPYAHIQGLAWRNGDEIVINPDRPFIPNLDDLPMPLHEMLPLHKQRHADDQGAVHLHRHQPRLPGRLQVLHQARQLSKQCARAFGGKHRRRAGASGQTGHPQHPHVRRSLHRQPPAGGRSLQADHRAWLEDPLDVQQPRRLCG
jgi:anaerobic magnesium-protoporphyrin IX monomethyl ester cyclase